MRADPRSVQISASGMQAARTLLDVHAHNIANVSTGDVVAQRVGLWAVEPRGGVAARVADVRPDHLADVVGLVVAKTMYDANAKAFALRAQTERALLDVRA